MMRSIMKPWKHAARERRYMTADERIETDFARMVTMLQIVVFMILSVISVWIIVGWVT